MPVVSAHAHKYPLTARLTRNITDIGTNNIDSSVKTRSSLYVYEQRPRKSYHICTFGDAVEPCVGRGGGISGNALIWMNDGSLRRMGTVGVGVRRCSGASGGEGNEQWGYLKYREHRRARRAGIRGIKPKTRNDERWIQCTMRMEAMTTTRQDRTGEYAKRRLYECSLQTRV